MNDEAEDMKDFIDLVHLKARWNELEPYRSEKTETRLASALKIVEKKFDGTLIFNDRAPEGVEVPGTAVVTRLNRDMVYGLSKNESLNDDYSELLLKVVSGMKYKSTGEEKNLSFLDMCLVNEMMLHNNVLSSSGGDPADNIEGLKYFWDFFAEPDERGWVSSARFCSFIGQVAHATKGGRGSDRGFLETFNIMALRHKRGEQNFIDLDVDKMLNSVNW